MAELAFFIGKGGVGKTTLAAAYALRTAARHPRRPLLLVSTDPAHSLADVLELPLGDSPARVPVPVAANLFAWQLNARKEFDKFLRKYRDPMLHLVESGTFFTREEIAPLLDTTLPGMAEFAALLAIHQALAAGRYHRIVVDTAPLGHTLRLFEMPEHFARVLTFLDVAGGRDRLLAQRFGGGEVPSQPLLAEWRALVSDVRSALSAKDSQLVLVTTPENFSLNESLRAAQSLAESVPRLKLSAVVLNRAVPRITGCRACSQRARATRAARVFLGRNFPRVSLHMAEDSGGPVLGAADLLAFAEHVFAGKKLNLRRQPPAAREPEFKKIRWPTLDFPLSLTLGKGGVGKTTISAALAVHQRASHRKLPLTICSTDPAPSLDDVFRQPIGERATAVLADPGLLALEIDSVAQFRRWSDGMKFRLDRAFASPGSGLHLDLSLDREIISTLLDVVPPGVDEIFAVFRILDLLSNGRRLLIDMAPTGHALELLRMPVRMQQWSRLLLKSLAPHRTLPLAQDAAVEIAEIGQRVRALAKMLKDGRRTRLWPVMLAEPMPDRETGRLLRQLEDLGAHVAPLFINRVIFAQDVGHCPRCRRAHAWQMATIAGLKRRWPGRKLYIVRNFDHEIAGRRALRRLTHELWQTL